MLFRGREPYPIRVSFTDKQKGTPGGMGNPMNAKRQWRMRVNQHIQDSWG